jgi:outer membrane receptor protein involved in Fe transport
VLATNHNGGFIDHIFPPLSDARLLQPGTGETVDPRVGPAGNIRKDSNKTDSIMGRVSMTYTPSDRLTFKLSWMRQKDEGDDAWQIDYNDSLDLVRSRYITSPQNTEFELTSLETAYQFGADTLTYIGGYYENELLEVIDATRFVTNSWARLNGDTFYPQAVAFPFGTHTRQATHELRLQGVDKALFSQIKFDYVLGAFYQHEVREGGYNIAAPEWNANKGPNTRAISTAGGLLSGVRGSGDYKNKAAFIDLTVHLTDKMSIGGGIRYFDQEKFTTNRNYGDVATPTRLPDDLSDPINRANGQPRLTTGTLGNSGTTPRFGFSYKLTDDKLLYVTAAKGERIASEPPLPSNTTATDPFCANLVQQLNLQDFLRNGNRSDEIWSYDMGLKTTWLENSLRLNTSVFYIDWTDLQQAVILNSISPQCPGVIQANVGAARVQGFEIETAYAPTDHLSFNGSIAHADGKITDPGPGVNDSIGQPLQKGDALTGVPEWTANVGAQLTFNLPRLPSGPVGYIRADWRYVSERINGFGDKESLRAAIPFNVAHSYELTDIRAGLDTDVWTAQVYVSNVFNKRAVFETMRDFAEVNLQDAAIAQPRTMGFKLNRRF